MIAVYEPGEQVETTSTTSRARKLALRDFHPSGRVIARLFPAADFAIDARGDEARGYRRTQQQMIDA